MKILRSTFSSIVTVLVLLSTGLETNAVESRITQRAPVFWRGVNLASAEFGVGQNGGGNLPGVYGIDYIYPNQGEVNYYKGKGMNIIRLPFRWERLQPKALGSFNPQEFNRLKTFVNQTTAKGVQVILDPHNYARYYGDVVGSRKLPNSTFADLWRRLAVAFKGNPKVIFGLMNEPKEMPTEQWVSAANAAIQAIRNQNANNLILVPGNAYSGAWTWYDNFYGTPNAQAMLKIKDPNNRYIFEVHQYMDRFASGTTENCINTTIGSERLKAFTKWLRTNKRLGFLGEFSAGRNQTCYKALADITRYVENNGDVWRGWTYWAGGPYWGNNNSIEPNNGKDKPQMNVLEQFLP